MHKLLQEVLELKLRQNPAVAEELPLLEKKVVAGQTAPYAAAKKDNRSVINRSVIGSRCRTGSVSSSGRSDEPDSGFELQPTGGRG